jgi:hypothetical protein
MTMLRFTILPSLMILVACANDAPDTKADRQSGPISIGRCAVAPATDAFTLAT